MTLATLFPTQTLPLNLGLSIPLSLTRQDDFYLHKVLDSTLKPADKGSQAGGQGKFSALAIEKQTPGD